MTGDTTDGRNGHAAPAEHGIDLRTPPPAADYSAWRERMRSKSQRNRTLITPPEPEPTNRRGPTYWDAETLFRDSEAIEAGEVDPLSVLDLRDTATSAEILQAYRRLAKVHHPDLFLEADEATRQYHDDCMRAINEAYAALRSTQRT